MSRLTRNMLLVDPGELDRLDVDEKIAALDALGQSSGSRNPGYLSREITRVLNAQGEAGRDTLHDALDRVVAAVNVVRGYTDEGGVVIDVDFGRANEVRASCRRFVDAIRGGAYSVPVLNDMLGAVGWPPHTPEASVAGIGAAVANYLDRALERDGWAAAEATLQRCAAALAEAHVATALPQAAGVTPPADPEQEARDKADDLLASGVDVLGTTDPAPEAPLPAVEPTPQRVRPVERNTTGEAVEAAHRALTETLSTFVSEDGTPKSTFAQSSALVARLAALVGAVVEHRNADLRDDFRRELVDAILAAAVGEAPDAPVEAPQAPEAAPEAPAPTRRPRRPRATPTGTRGGRRKPVGADPRTPAPGTVMTRTYHGVEYRCEFTGTEYVASGPDGEIARCDNPSRAARAITDTNTNGWKFWGLNNA